MKKIINWIVLSSADPTKYSLTIKGILGGLITLAVAFGLNPGELNPLADAVMRFIEQIAGVITTLIFIVGAVRKLALTIKGEHPLLQ